MNPAPDRRAAKAAVRCFGAPTKRDVPAASSRGFLPRLIQLSAALALLAAIATALPVSAFGFAPHVPAVQDPDNCAMCHRAHSSASAIRYGTLYDPEVTGSALIVGTAENDSQLCYSCHGVDALGAETDVQSSFTAASSHLLAPDTSEYGPSPKGCSDCHDSHGSSRTAEGTPYPELLRVFSSDGSSAYYSGDAYCGACHVDRPDDVWDGMAIWQATAHSRIATPASGTDIVCSSCHEPHGSDNPPNIRETLLPPAVSTDTPVPANDRRFCLACHKSDEGDTWRGGDRYAVSSHGVTEATVTVEGEWASAETTRKVGECQSCHAPMGRADDEGGLVPKLAQKHGRELCYDCHDLDGPASANLASLEPTDATASYRELAVAAAPAAGADAYDRVQVFFQDPVPAAERVLLGPREHGARDTASGSGASRGYGPLTAGGDVDGDGKPDLVVADPERPVLRFLTEDARYGFSERTHSLPSGRPPADFVAVADFVLDAQGALEIAVVSSADSTDSAQAYLYREILHADQVTRSLSEIAGPLEVGNGASSVAVGDVTGSSTATDTTELVVTAGADDAFYVLSGASGSFIADGPHGTGIGSAPGGASCGDAWRSGGKEEIVVLRPGSAGAELALYSGSGTLLQSLAVGGSGEASASVTADVLAGLPGEEVVVARDAGSGTSGITVFPRNTDGSGGLVDGLDAAATLGYVTGDKYRSGSLAVGQLDGAGAAELVVGNAGWSWESTSSAWQPPSAQVFHASSDGTAFASEQTIPIGGAELAGGAPSLAVGDLGQVGPSRHPVDVAEAAHVSTETAPVERHVQCVDCHNVHEATSTPTAADGSAPSVYGRLVGAWGVALSESGGSWTYTEQRGIEREYELCAKCHAGTWAEGVQRDVIRELYTTNPSFHGVIGTQTVTIASGSFVTTSPAWDGSSEIYCADCHGDSKASRPRGLHVSEEAPLLASPYLNAAPSDGEALCYTCHRQAVYEGTADGSPADVTLTYFRESTTLNLHVRHSGDFGLSCRACHTSHGSAVEARLLRDDLLFERPAGTDGECSGLCHQGAAKSYTR